MPYVIRKIGTDGFGIVAVAQVVMLYFSTFSDYGFYFTATRDVALQKEDIPKISRLFFTVLASKTIITIVSFLVLLVFVEFIPFFADHASLYLLGFTYVIGQSLMVSWFFQGVEKMHYITFITLIARIIFVVLIFVFIQVKEDNVLFLFLLGASNSVAGLISIFLAIRIFKLSFIRPSWQDIKHEFKEGWQITLSNLSINTYLYINVVVLRIFSTDLVVGYYSIAEKIFLAARQVLSIFSQAVYPQVCQLALKGKKEMNGFFKDIYFPFLLMVVVGCVAAFILSPYIIYIFLGEYAEMPMLLLRILIFTPVIVCLNIPAYQILLAFNERKRYSRTYIMGTVLNILCNFLLANWWGPIGTAISIIITELFITAWLNAELYKSKRADLISLPI